MVDAAEPTVLKASVAEIGAAVRAMDPEKSGAALLIAKQDQVFAEELDWQWRTA
jgi:hypothetical protein